VFLKNVEEYDSHVRQVMKMFMDEGLIFKIKKYVFDTMIVNYLGMIYTLERLKI
jgi:hypothetical protein